MKKRWIFALCAALAVLFPQEAAQGALEGLTLFACSVAPSLFPLMALMLLFSRNMTGGAGLITALGWCSGSPCGAKLTLLSGQKNSAALKTAALTGTMSPMFFLSVLDAWLGGCGALMLVCHLSGALVTGLLFGEKTPNKAFRLPAQSFGDTLRDAAMAMLGVCACMTLGMTAARIARSLIPNESVLALVQALLEPTSGARAVCRLPFSMRTRGALLCAAASFGGLSLLTQNAAFLQKCGVPMKKLCCLRLFHAGTAMVMFYFVTGG